jgi:two-component system invasion response regulator UvrY
LLQACASTTDDHPIVMTGFAMSLQGQGLDVVAQARTPEDALAQFQQLQPDVVVLDIRFGEQLTGLDVAKQILAQAPSAAIVFLSQFDQDSLIRETYRLGGRAFMTKDCDPADLAAAVRRA